MSFSDTPTNDLAREGKALHRAIDFGFQVEAFLQSEIGQYLFKRSDDQVADAVERLKRVDPENVTQVRALLHLIHVAEDIQYWLADAIQSGQNAQDQLIERNH